MFPVLPWHHYPDTNFHDMNLDWVILTVKEAVAHVQNMEEWIRTHQTEYEELKALYDQIISGDFPESVTAAFENWMRRNALDLVGELAKMVIFNITDDGYFVAYIPECWDDIIFGTTGLDLTLPGYEYGRLVLSYNIP